VPSSSTTRSPDPPAPPDDAAARTGLAHRAIAGVLAVEGGERADLLQGQLTQDVRGLAPGQSRLAAGLTPKGKLLYFGRLVGEPERLLLLIPEQAIPGVVAHLGRYAALQKASVRDASAEYVRVALYGPGAAGFSSPAGVRLPADGEIAGEILAPAGDGDAIRRSLAAAGSVSVSDVTAEVLRVEAGRPRLFQDATDASLPDELGLQAAISATKGCYVGQEVVARLRTYGRVNRRLAGLRFPHAPQPAGTVFTDPEKESLELARVTSSVVSPRFGPIGLGLVFREVPDGASLVLPGKTDTAAVVCELPFA
jgi:folate-binding protein YgfZ